jgi:hypothetical protein
VSEMDERERWRQETARALARLGEVEAGLAAHRDEPPAPGDLYVLALPIGAAVEWLVVAETAGPEGGRLLLIPGDTNPLLGSADVEVPAGEPGGALYLRCRHGLWVAAGVLAGAKRSGRVAAARVERARRTWKAAEEGSLRVGASAAEVDADPEYQDWADEVAAARAALAAAAGATRVSVKGASAPLPPRRRMPFWLPQALAALFLLATVGLSLWVAALRRQIDELSTPVVDPPGEQLRFGEEERGTTTLTVPPGSRLFLLTVVLGIDTPPYPSYRVDLVAAGGRTLFRTHPFTGGVLSELPLVLPRPRFPEGRYRVRLYGLAAGGERLLEEREISIEPPAP